LCILFGIGLVLFNNNNPLLPEYEIRNRPIRGNPDYFYVNKNIKIIENDLFN
jgi:hypothetical protein